jgi:heparosan-N-sulfate-glucuronate 5-epimerase
MKLIEMIKAYSGMVFGKKDYWHPDMLVNNNVSPNSIGAYYVDTRPKHIYIGKFDNEDIPLLEFDGSYKYFPVTIAQYALGNFDMYLDTNDIKYFKIAEKCADWLLNNLEEIEPNVFGYINNVDKDIYSLKKVWLSSLAQGQALSLLARCYSINRNEKYIRTCKKILVSYEVLSEDKGVLSYLNDNYFYEEYPSSIPSFVLNGFIFSLWGLLDFYIVSKDEKANELYRKGLKTLEKNIHLYNVRFINWSRYDLYPFKIIDITSGFYHKLHIEQLKAMYLLTNKEIYKEYYTKWENSYNNKAIYVIATIYKIIHKLSVRKQSNYVPSVEKKA